MNIRNNQIFRTVLSGMIMMFIIIGCSGNPIMPDPPQVISVSPSEGVENSQVTFTAETTGGSVADWLWDFADAASPATSTESQPTVTLGDNGSYDCSVTVSNEDGEDTLSFTLTITEDIPQVVSVNPGEGVENSQVTFSAETTGTVTDWLWDFADAASPSTSTEPQPTVTLSDKGSYDCSVAVSNENGEDTLNFTLNITEEVLKVVSVNPGEGVEYTEVIFTADVTGGIVKDIKWAFDDAASPSSSTKWQPTVTLGSKGSYDCSVTVRNDQDEDTLNFTLTVDHPDECYPAPAITTTEIPVATAGVPYHFRFSATDGHGELTWSLTEESVLPSDLSFNPYGHGLLTGVPFESGDFPLTVKVADSCFEVPQMDSVSFTFTVLPDPGPAPGSNWKWAKTWGGLDHDYAYSVAADDSGNVYVTGSYNDTAEFNPDGGGEQTSIEDEDAYLAKYDSDGNWQWAKTWGGTSNVSGRSVVADNQGNVYVVGKFVGTVDFNPDGGGTEDSGSTYLSKFDSNGNWLWTKTWEGGGWKDVYSVVTDNNSNVYVTGYFTAGAILDPDGVSSQYCRGEKDVYLSKFDSDGNWQWAKTWGGSDEDIGYSVAVDNPGDIYVTGRFEHTVEFNPDGGGEQTAYGSGAFLSKFDSEGNWFWSKTWESSRGYSVATDDSGNVYVTGTFGGTTDFNPDGGDEQSDKGWGSLFISKFDTDGNYYWARTWGSGSMHWGILSRSVATGIDGSVYVTGWIPGPCEFDPNGGGELGGFGHAYLSKFDSDGNWHWAETWGQVYFLDYESFSVAADNSGNVYVIGSFGGSLSFNLICEFNPAGGGAQISKGNIDSYLTKFHDD